MQPSTPPQPLSTLPILTIIAERNHLQQRLRQWQFLEGSAEEPPSTAVSDAATDDKKAHALKRDRIRELVREEGMDFRGVGREGGRVLLPLEACPRVPSDAAASQDHELEDLPVGKAGVGVVDGAADDRRRWTLNQNVSARQDQQLSNFLTSVKTKMERLQDKRTTCFFYMLGYRYHDPSINPSTLPPTC